jgi:transposase
MDVVHPICCGIDVHKEQVTACIRIVEAQGRVHTEVEEFSTVVSGLMALAQWLSEANCPVVAMESTGVYWKPVYHILSEQVEVVVGNAREMRPPPGKKTDKKDAKWIAELLAHGLIRPSFVPPPQIAALRSLTRTRVKLVQMRTQAKNRVHQVLEDTNIKLSSVVSDLFGVSARKMLDALVSGEREPSRLAALALGTLKQKIPALELALEGQFTEQHGLLIRLSLAQVDLFNEQIAQLDEQIAVVLEPMSPEVEQLCSIPGVNQTAAQGLIGEFGTALDRFVSAERLASWAGVCPGNNESAGKRRSGRTRKGNRWIRRLVVQCAWAARRTDTHLGKTFRRLEKRLGGKKAALAVGHKIVVIVYHLLTEGTFYEEARYARPNPKEDQRRIRRAVGQLESLGYEVDFDEGSQVRHLVEQLESLGYAVEFDEANVDDGACSAAVGF